MAKESPMRRTSAKPKPYPAEKARGGDVILDTPVKRWVFIAGLVGAVVLALVLGFLR